MADAELKPCPFCGGAVELERTTGSYEKMHGQREWWGVVCRNTINVGGTCAIQQVPSASKEAAVERWNCRATHPTEAGAPTASAYPSNEIMAEICEVAGYANLSMQQIREVFDRHAPTSGRESAAPDAEQDAKDAARYRWLRDHGPEGKPAVFINGRWHGAQTTSSVGFALDAAIDVAMQKGAQ